jgi:predicted N-acetyltransferase YhbS
MINIRHETIADYAAIARVNARAFSDDPKVGLIPTLHRQRTRFDPELSLVAEQDGRIIGHVLFSPQTIRLLGQDVEVVNLSPLAVDPDFQRQGIGGMLVREGHRVAKAKGYPLSFLVGHPPYYPRFGYLPNAYSGWSSLRTSTAAFVAGDLETRTPTETDIPALRDLWRHEEGGVDFSIDPGGELLSWLSPNPVLKSLVYTLGGEVVGYARVHTQEPRAPYFLARDGETARQMARRIGGMRGVTVDLSLHPYSASSAALGTAECQVGAYAMVCPFVPSVFDDYYAQVQAGTRIGGRSIWGVEFDVS